MAAFTVHRTTDPALPDDLRAAIRTEYDSLGWLVPQALAHCPPNDQVAQIELPHWSRGRVTLLGDACQAVSLLAGQGASLAVAGANLLADNLAQTASIPAGLRSYEQTWRPVLTHRQRSARTFAHWFVPDSWLRQQTRHLALHLARLPGTDRLLAATLTGPRSRSDTAPRSA